eukprot:CAMPEP_0194235998 /NCGR_PEP_ID=MMETSP0158-20130606/3355_1 /TAXON_ID=33649 /ORGANISM="Thalassionema nitzschioides, Strain L26-B" /LENGTH=226 /DNA_ID=CAMNT_0038969631 /DNA_START=58 /DNA_END=738 /DNA_ORIENTATION=+
MTQISSSAALEQMVRAIVHKYQRQQERIHREKETDAKEKNKRRSYDPWQARFDELVDFKMKHHHCLVPFTYPQNQPLGCWVKKQRYAYKQYLKQQEEIKLHGSSGINSSMAENRIKMLDEIGFIWDSHQAKWEQMFRDLLEYKKKHGDCDVPCKYPPNKALGLWVTRQRITMRESGSNPSKLTIKRMMMLESAGFMWGCTYKGAWDKKHHEMLNMKQKYGLVEYRI